MTGRYYWLILLIFGSFTTAALGQNISVEGFAGYGTYQMRDLKNLLQVELEEVEIPVRITENFPPYVNGGFQVGVHHDFFETGFRYGHYSTGGRVHYKDYSGEYGFDVTMNAHTIGAFTRMVLFEKQKFQLKGAVAGLACFSYGKIEEYLIVNGEKDNLLLEVASTSFVLEPSLVPTLQVADVLYVGLSLGCALDLGGGLHLAEDREAKLVDNKGEPITTNWYGIRTGILLGIMF
jgi:hypothetical protein